MKFHTFLRRPSAMAFTFGVTFLLFASAVYCGKPNSPCPAPTAPEHGEVILFEEGRVAEYVCDPGYAIKGKEIVPCVDGKWEESEPSCVEIEGKSELVNKDLDKGLENETDAQLNNSISAKLEDDEGYQSDDAQRQLLWYAHYYNNGVPAVMSLTESQLRWIDSLHPELRDQYLRGAYIVRAEPERVASLIARDAYDYIYGVPYVRRAASSIFDNVVSTYDYTCNQAGYPVIPAPDLPNMHVARYDSRKNIYEPHNYYLSAVYQCDPGYYMLDSRFSELYCSRGQWVGASPVCVSNP